MLVVVSAEFSHSSKSGPGYLLRSPFSTRATRVAFSNIANNGIVGGVISNYVSTEYFTKFNKDTDIAGITQAMGPDSPDTLYFVVSLDS